MTNSQRAAISASKKLKNKTEKWVGNSHRDMDRAAHNYKKLLNQGYKQSKQATKYQGLRDDFLQKASGMGEFKYDPKYTDRIEGLLGDAENMKFKMNYSLTDDPAYQQYRDQFVHQGQLAAQDAMGNAVAQTGGYGSTAAAAASQQAYNEQLTQLNNIVPELYGQAFDREFNVFANQRDTLQNLAAAYQSLDQQGYEQALGTWQNNFNQYITLAEEYNRNYEYLDSAEREEYAQKLDGLEKLLTWRTDLYQNNQQLYAGAVGDYGTLANDIAGQEEAARQFDKTNALNWAEFEEGKRQFDTEMNETIRSHRASEDAAKKAAEAKQKEKQEKENDKKTKEEYKTLTKTKGNRNTAAYSNQLLSKKDYVTQTDTKNASKDYPVYVAQQLSNWIKAGKITEAEAKYIAISKGVNV